MLFLIISYSKNEHKVLGNEKILTSTDLFSLDYDSKHLRSKWM